MENSIIIRKLPKNMYVPELCESFRCFGNIISATIQCDDNNMSIGEAYVEFENKFSALKAVESMNNYRLKGRLIDVSLSIESSHFKQVFVKNCSSTWDDLDLMKAFEHIGSIQDAKISEEHGKSNGYGFIVFEHHFAAKRAVESMNGKKIDGKELIVERYKNKTERENLMQNSLEQVKKRLQQSKQLNNLHVKNLPADMSEDQFRKLFEKYGEIINIKIETDENGVSKQFGFVCFKNNEDAKKAMERINGHTLKGKKLHVNYKEDGQLRKQYHALKSKERDVKIKQYKQRAKSVPKFFPHSLNYREPCGKF